MTIDETFAALRTTSPLVHNITNYVAMNITANVLLAAGASPAMVHADEEVADFVPISNALTINIGTLSPSWVGAMKRAAHCAVDTQTPWVLDPVAHFATPYRQKVVTELVALAPTIIRGNASEILALSGAVSAGKGVDAGDSVADAETGAMALAQAQSCVVAVTGAVDFVTDGTRSARVSGGSDLMPKVTAMGCSLTGLMGAFAAVSEPFDAALGAVSLYAVAGSHAAKTARGPGSFEPAFLDALSLITPEILLAEAQIEWV
ncbi:MAG: hydroxyethylthiazole kinase [Halocynthiibacter sp.]